MGTISVLSTDENKAPPRSGRGKEFSGRLTGRAFEHKAGDRFARHWYLLCGARWILESVEPQASEEVERAWEEEIVKRVEKIDSGTAKFRPWEEIRKDFEGLDMSWSGINFTGTS